LSVLLEESKDVVLEDEFPDYFFHPHSRFLQCWNGLSATAVLYIAISLPLRMGFDMSTSFFEKALDCCLDLFFLLDMALNFRTGAHGEWWWQQW
jgi:hypothetical protein